MSETYAQRKERVRQRDAIRSFAFAVAEHTARGDMNTVEKREPRTWPPLKFGRPIRDHSCECGMQMVPLPRFLKRWGILPTWYCVVCNLEGVVETCERIREEAARPVQALKPQGAAA